MELFMIIVLVAGVIAVLTNNAEAIGGVLACVSLAGFGLAIAAGIFLLIVSLA